VTYSTYGEGPVISRLDGVGNGGKFLDLDEATLQSILDGKNDGTLTYKPGRGPIDVKIYNPVEVVDGNYTLEIRDNNMPDSTVAAGATWILKKEGETATIASERSIDRLNEQIVSKYGFSISIANVPDPGTATITDKTNGAIGSEVTYKDPANPWLIGTPDNAPGFGNVLNYMSTGALESDFDLDPQQALGRTDDKLFFAPYGLCEYRDVPNEARVSPAWMNNSGGSVRGSNPLSNLNNVDIILTPDKSKWSRCVIVETAVPYYYDGGLHPQGPQFPTIGRAKHFDLRQQPSVSKDALANDANKPAGQQLTGEAANGMGWFPGYAIDVETGKRVNIFFGENSSFDPDIGQYNEGNKGINRDMMFNPGTQLTLPTQGRIDPAYFTFLGGQHFVYVTNQPYDGCINYQNAFTGLSFKKTQALKDVQWAGMLFSRTGTKMLSYKDGLIPNEVTIKLRVNNSYKGTRGKGTNNIHPAYKFTLSGKQSKNIATFEKVGVDSLLNYINIVPNPYYGFSNYEINELATTVKITNLPAKATVTIYTLDGRFIQQFKRDERPTVNEPRLGLGVRAKQIAPDLEWDIKNEKGIPLASGVYLIHVDAGELGQRTVKFFVINRQFDPSRL
jgi:hypothetical protein